MLAALADERYISLTTYRRDGTAVSTPVWVVTADGRRLLVWSPARTWKVRRLRRDPRVLVAASSFRGRERGPRVPGRARVRTDLPVEHLLRAKYGWQKRILDLLNRGTTGDGWVTIEISATTPTGSP